MPSFMKRSTELVTEMPRSCSIAIQSDKAAFEALRAFTAPASRMAPPYSRSFSVRVVFPASGWEMMAKVQRAAASFRTCADIPENTGFVRDGAIGRLSDSINRYIFI